MSDKEQMDQTIIEQQLVVENEDNNIQSNTEDNLVGHALPEDDGNQKKYGESAANKLESLKIDVQSDYDLNCGCECTEDECGCDCDFDTEIECRCLYVHLGECYCSCKCVNEDDNINVQKYVDETDNQINRFECDSLKCDEKI